MHGVQVTVISFIRSGDGVALGLGQRQRQHPGPGHRAGRGGRRRRPGRPPAEDANDLVAGDRRSPDWDDAAGRDRHPRVRRLRPRAGRGVRPGRRGGRVLYGFVNHEVTTTYLGSTTGLRLRHVQPTGHWAAPARPATSPRAPGSGGATRDFADVDALAIDETLAQRLGWGARAVDLPAGRYDTILPPTRGGRPDDRRLLVRRRPGRLGGPVGLQPPGDGTRIGEPIAAPGRAPLLRPGLPRPGVRAVRRSPARPATSTSVFDNGLPLEPHRLDPRRRADRAAADPALRRDDQQPVTPGDRQPGARGRRRHRPIDDLVAGTERGLLLTCLWYIREVDPQTLLLTGLTRDGVYLVEDGEVTGAVNNFRFNESPIDLLRRFTHASATVPSFSREWGDDYFSRTATPALRVPDFNMSSVSQAM